MAVRKGCERTFIPTELEKLQAATNEYKACDWVSNAEGPICKGAERIVYDLQHMSKTGGLLPQKFVGKESRYHLESESQMAFHETFCCTQEKANKLAREFNVKITSLPLFCAGSGNQPPIIEFLSCPVFEYCDKYTKEQRGILVEKRLKGHYEKYNGNNGFVCRKSTTQTMSILGDSDTVTVPYTAFLQAFSHWTHRHSHGKLLVCDLQGVFDGEGRRPKFLLTDPAICSEGTGRKFGDADQGSAGVSDFYRKHTCNRVCDALGIRGHA